MTAAAVRVTLGGGVARELQPGDPPTIGPYRLVGRLGGGGMGRVFLGVSAGGRPVAVKVILDELAADPEFRMRFGREVAAARRVNGMFTATVVDADVDGTPAWLATAYVPGPSLSEAVADHGPLPPESLLTLTAGLAESLSAIHAAGVVHRDLKPSNVLLAPDGPRVIDFGISLAVESAALTQAGVVIGSPGFMSPEQAEGRDIGPPSDIFSLGAVLAFAATGGGPFGAGTTAALLYRVVHGVPDLDRVPANVRPLIERCLAKDSRQRPTASGLLAEVGALQPTADWLPESIIRAFAADTAPSPAFAAGTMPPRADQSRAGQSSAGQSSAGQSSAGQSSAGQFGADQFGAGQFGETATQTTSARFAGQATSAGSAGQATSASAPATSADGLLAEGGGEVVPAADMVPAGSSQAAYARSMPPPPGGRDTPGGAHRRPPRGGQRRGGGSRPRRRTWRPLAMAWIIGFLAAACVAVFVMTALNRHTPTPNQSPAAQISASTAATPGGRTASASASPRVLSSAAASSGPGISQPASVSAAPPVQPSKSPAVSASPSRSRSASPSPSPSPTRTAPPTPTPTPTPSSAPSSAGASSSPPSTSPSASA
jgi:serine/threonine protein kinase